MKNPDPFAEQQLIPPHGGYRSLKSFQVARLVYDLTVRFCDRFVSRFSRTNDQMVQAARSGVQNIAEGSQVSGTSKKSEIKLTNVARASLEELILDYEDFLRHHNLRLWHRNDPHRRELIARRFDNANDVVRWIHQIHKQRPCPLEEAAANAIHTLIGVSCSLLSRQLQALSEQFLENGGFNERLYTMRKAARSQNPDRLHNA